MKGLTRRLDLGIFTMLVIPEKPNIRMSPSQVQKTIGLPHRDRNFTINLIPYSRTIENIRQL